jgi:hypothetical protein
MQRTTGALSRASGGAGALHCAARPSPTFRVPRGQVAGYVKSWAAVSGGGSLT